MKISQLLTAPNQLTLLRMLFLPFIIINLVDRHYEWALGLFVFAGLSDGLDGFIAREDGAIGHSELAMRRPSGQ